jgi:hypothetical protein
MRSHVRTSTHTPPAREAALEQTLPGLLARHARTRPDEVAIREKRLGVWRELTWREYHEHVRATACLLAELGVRSVIFNAFNTWPARGEPRLLPRRGGPSGMWNVTARIVEAASNAEAAEMSTPASCRRRSKSRSNNNASVATKMWAWIRPAVR